MTNETKAKRAKRVVSIDQAKFSVATAGQSYGLAPLPDQVKTYLALLGLKTALLMSALPAGETYGALMSGAIPEQKAPPAEKKSKWRTAVAHTMAQAKANEINPGAPKRLVTEAFRGLLPDMEAKAALLDRATIKRLAERADVQEQYRKLFGPKEALETSIFAALDSKQPAAAALVEDELV